MQTSWANVEQKQPQKVKLQKIESDTKYKLHYRILSTYHIQEITCEYILYQFRSIYIISCLTIEIEKKTGYIWKKMLDYVLIFI